MKLLKLLNKKNLSILIFFFIQQNLYSTEPVDIWNIELKPNKEEIKKEEIVENELPESSLKINSQEISEIQIKEVENQLSENFNVSGIYDPSDNNLSMDMWKNSNGDKILEIINKVKELNLSKDSTEILNIALLTNSYFPQNNITREEFLVIKSDWLIKQKNLNFIESYLEKNKNLENQNQLIKYYLDYHLSKADLGNACKIFDKINKIFSDDYISKFNIYCLINLDKKEEAVLQFDLLKETGFEDEFFEKNFLYLMDYLESTDNVISENSLLDFHLSHRINSDFKFEPNLKTPKIIWKYLFSSNLLEKVDDIDLENEEKIFTLEKATHDKNYDEVELFLLYERFLFNINQLLTVKETYKLLPKYKARALLYQCILLNKKSSERIELIKILKNLFEEDDISNAFDIKLVQFLKELDENEIPSNLTNFYYTNLKNKKEKNTKIKFNNKIIYQSKLLNFFIEDKNNVEKDLESILKKIKKDKKYFFSIKDSILLESLKSEGVKIPKKYSNMYEPYEINIPYDIQLLIKNNEIGLILLRLVEIIGEDEIKDMDAETLYFIVGVLNQLNIDKVRNKILLEVLPLKV